MTDTQKLQRLQRELAGAMKFKRDETKLRKIAIAIGRVDGDAGLYLRGQADYKKSARRLPFLSGR